MKEEKKINSRHWIELAGDIKLCVYLECSASQVLHIHTWLLEYLLIALLIIIILAFT